MSLVKSILIGIASFIALLFVIGFFIDSEKLVQSEKYVMGTPELFEKIFKDPQQWANWHDQLKDNDKVVLTPSNSGVGAILEVEIPQVQYSILKCTDWQSNSFTFSTQMGQMDGGIDVSSTLRWVDQGANSYRMIYESTWNLGANPINKLLSFMIEDYYSQEQQRTLDNIKDLLDQEMNN